MQFIKRSFGLTTALFFILFSSIAHQVLAQNYPDPFRYDETMAEFAEQDRLDPPAQGAIVLTGSSSITRWNDQAKAALAPLTVIPRGFGGSIMHDVLHHLDQVALKYNPRAILIYEGDNDTGVERYEIKPQMIIDDFKKIVARIHQELPETRIYVMSVKPSVSRWAVWDNAKQASAGYKEIADHDPLVFYIDAANPFLDVNGEVMTDIFVDDGLHFNALGDAIWGSIIKAGLMPVEARYEAPFTKFHQ